MEGDFLQQCNQWLQLGLCVVHRDALSMHFSTKCPPHPTFAMIPIQFKHYLLLQIHQGHLLCSFCMENKPYILQLKQIQMCSNSTEAFCGLGTVKDTEIRPASVKIGDDFTEVFFNLF